jgi:hypothetical protein
MMILAISKSLNFIQNLIVVEVVLIINTLSDDGIQRSLFHLFLKNDVCGNCIATVSKTCLHDITIPSRITPIFLIIGKLIINRRKSQHK